MSERRSILANGIKLAYEISGDPAGPPVVLLHALGERGADWADLAGVLAKNYLVIAPDLRGHGDSDWPGSYSFILMRDDIAGLLDGLGLGAVTLGGHSLGGIVAFMLAVSQPSRFTRLIIEDVVPPYGRERAMPERPDGVELPFDWAALTETYAEGNARDQQLWDGLAAITAPTLLIGGGQDSNIPQQELAEVAARIPRCDLVTIEAGHHVHRFKPAEFTETVTGWLGAG